MSLRRDAELDGDYLADAVTPRSDPRADAGGGPAEFSDAPPLIGLNGGPSGPAFGPGPRPPRPGPAWKPQRPTDESVLAALKWLARHQSDRGFWAADFDASCGCSTGLKGAAPYDVGVTGLALLAFLGAGYTPASRDGFDGRTYGDVIKRAGEFLMESEADGMYGRAIAALALAELYGATSNARYRAAAQRAVDFVADAQNPGSGWRYVPQAGESDTSVTGWAVMALRSARIHGLDVDRDVAFDGARAWLNRVAFQVADGTGRRWLHGYQEPTTVCPVIPGMNDEFDSHPSMSAVATLCRAMIDRKRDDPKLVGGVDAVLDDLPRRDAAAVDYYYWYYASLALYQYTAGRGARWEKFERAIDAALVPAQNLDKASHRFGSWEPVDRWSCRGGRVYATAINALTLEVYYRYASVFTGLRKDD